MGYNGIYLPIIKHGLLEHLTFIDDFPRYKPLLRWDLLLLRLITGGYLIQSAYLQWPFQEPKLEVPTIYKAYFTGLCKGIYPQNMVLYGTVPPF